MGKRKRRFRPPLWLIRLKAALVQVLFPLMVFQFFRTLLFPTTLDVILLALFVILFFCLAFGLF